jgi:photosystem II stability/assembly factor-like uncharacterized protein
VPPTGLDGSLQHKFKVIGRYYAGEVCTLLIATNGLPVCPAAPGGVKPPYTTHPDQHASLWVPDGSGGVTLVAGNDGGIYKQHVASGEELSNNKWGQGKRKDADGNEVSGANDGLSTLQPYDAAMSGDGTLYMGLQDNGEVKIDPDGTTYSVYGGDGFYTAVHPTNSKIAYEEYTYGVMSVTTDGGVTWTDITPANLTSSQFGTPFEMDQTDADHLMIGGRDVEETTAGPDTSSSSWKTVYDLGTQQHPGDADAAAASDDPDNQLSAVDLRASSNPADLPTGPKTADQQYENKGGDTLPGHDQSAGLTGQATQLPGTYNDYPVTIGPDDGDAAMRISATWADSAEDWDLYLYREETDGSLTYVDSSASGGTTFERLRELDPQPGDYVVRVVNWEALGTYDLAITFTQRTAAAQQTSAAYVGYCGYCDTITQGTPFANGIATNVGGDKPGVPGSSDGWHIAAAQGLPDRYITSARIDPSDPRTVYFTLAGYARRWAAPGAVGDDTSNVGTGHVFVSTDAGEHFSDISANLPDAPANWSALHDGRLVVGTDVGVFISCNAQGGTYAALGTGLPNVPISTLRFKAGDPDLLVAATFGRGIWTHRFDDSEPLVCHGTPADANPDAGGSAGLQPFGKGAVEVKIAKKVKRKHNQRVRVKLISTVGSELSGTVRLKTKPNKHRLGKVATRPKPRKVTLKPAGKAKLRMKLTAASRKALRQGRKVKATAIVKLADANGRKVSLKKSKRVKRAAVRR